VVDEAARADSSADLRERKALGVFEIVKVYQA
jgi:hypothetical protein